MTARPAKRASKSAGVKKIDPLERVRALCLGLDGVVEEIAHGRPCFKARKKTFVMFMDNHHDDGRLAIWCKAPPGAQALLVGADPARFFVPPYVGHQGWIGARLEGRVPWAAIAELVAEGHAMTAAKRGRRD